MDGTGRMPPACIVLFDCFKNLEVCVESSAKGTWDLSKVS